MQASVFVSAFVFEEGVYCRVIIENKDLGALDEEEDPNSCVETTHIGCTDVSFYIEYLWSCGMDIASFLKVCDLGASSSHRT